MKTRYDFNEDTQSIEYYTKNIVGRFYELAAQYHCVKEVDALHSTLMTLYAMTHCRMKEDAKQQVRRNLEEVRNKLYGVEKEIDSQMKSKLFDKLDKCFQEVSKVLDQEGILWRIRPDPDAMVAQ
jgi:hypothetical protein